MIAALLREIDLFDVVDAELALDGFAGQGEEVRLEAGDLAVP